MRIDDFNKRKKPVMRFIDKYFGAKYSIAFVFVKEFAKKPPSIMSVIQVGIGGWCVWTLIKYGGVVLVVLIGLYVVVYSINKIRYLIKNKVKKEEAKKEGDVSILDDKIKRKPIKKTNVIDITKSIKKDDGR